MSLQPQQVGSQQTEELSPGLQSVEGHLALDQINVPATGRRLFAANAHVFELRCDFDYDGPWSGVRDLYAALLPSIAKTHQELLERYSFELTQISPSSKRFLTARHLTLTDLAPDQEKVRNYAADRAFRIVHGLIDMLEEWKRIADPGQPWVLLCHNLEQAGPICRRYFAELARRAAVRSDIHIYADLAPLTDTRPAQSPEKAKDQAGRLEQKIELDSIEKVECLPQMITLWKEANQKAKVAYWKHFGMAHYCSQGLYADALQYGDGLLELVRTSVPESEYFQWSVVNKSVNALIGVGNIEGAFELAQGEAKRLSEFVPPILRSEISYLMAMLHSRYLQPRDFEKGEAYLEQGLSEIAQADIPESDRCFHTVFNRNGLAMIRTFQKRHQEAMDLCKWGMAQLDEKLEKGQHRLHRSVLQYNVAQLYTQMGALDEALEHYAAAMAMDPNYSEYYNERGGILLRLNRLEEAVADYRKAIDLSAPYYEVQVNLGQCFRQIGDMAKAIESYTRALDLEPNQVLALVGRAKAHEELGHIEDAIADYNHALRLEPDQWEAVANRAVLQYQAGDLQSSLEDLNTAIRLNPEAPSLYLNRSVAYDGLGYWRAAVSDIETALRMGLPKDDEDGARERLTLLSAKISEESAIAV